MIFFFDCPSCGERSMKKHKVGNTDGRTVHKDRQVYRRRYKCLKCGARATSYEILYHNTLVEEGKSPPNGNGYKIDA